MSNILATATQVLDLLVPLEDAERTRVVSAVRAMLDLTETIPVYDVVMGGKPMGDGVAVVRRPLTVAAPKKAKEKPARRAPKAPRRVKVKPASELESKILEAIRLGNSRPKNIAKTIGTSSQSYQFRRALLKLLESKAVTAKGAASGRHYHAGTAP